METKTNDNETVPFEEVMLDDDSVHGIGELSGELPDEYLSVTVDRDRLQQLLDIAETLDWETVTFSLYNGKPILLRNEHADNKPTLAVAPRLHEMGEEE